MRLVRYVSVLALLCAAAVSHAESMTYTITYSGSGSDNGGLSDPGSGSLTYTYASGSTTGTLSAFSFTDTLQARDGAKSTYSYGLSSVGENSIALGADGQIVSAYLFTSLAPGSDLSFGPVEFGLFFGPPLLVDTPNFSYTDEFGPFPTHYKDGNSDGAVTLTLVPNVASTPEPSSIALLGTGAVGLIGVLRKRSHR